MMLLCIGTSLELLWSCCRDDWRGEIHCWLSLLSVLPCFWL